MAGPRGVWVGGSGNQKSDTVTDTVDAIVGVPIGACCMLFFSTSPANVPATSVVDRCGKCLYLPVNGDGEVAVEGATKEGELSARVADGDEEDERGSGACFGLWKSSTLAGERLRMGIRKLGEFSSPGGTMGVDGIYVVVVLVPVTPKDGVKLLIIVLEPSIGELGREPGTGGTGAVGGFISGGIIFRASRGPRSAAPNLPSSVGEFK